MPKGYWVTIYRKISDPQKLAAYAELAPKATHAVRLQISGARHGGERL